MEGLTIKYIIAKKTGSGQIEFFAGITKSETPELAWTTDKSKARRYADQDAVLRHLCMIPGGMWKEVEE